MRQTVQKFLAMNRSYKKFKPVGVVLHETATPGATASAEFKYFNSAARGASAHAFVDWTETIQMIPWDEVAWHAKEPANSQFIGIEMCRPKVHDTEKFEIVYNEAVALFSRLFFIVLKINRVSKDNLMSHDEVRLKWRNTSHTDPTAYLKEYGKNMDGFRTDVQAAIDKLQSNNVQTKSAIPDSIIKPNNNNNPEHVKVLQTQLNKFGYKLKVDGDYGKISQGAVKDFQETKGLTKDGIVGPATWKKLFE
jgi:N-acetylmuramoyl-L-alanine amidase CwlA